MTCLRCGKCCTSFGVCVTPFDILRIRAATGTSDFVAAIPEPPERERSEPAVLISGKRSLIVLKWQKARRCVFYSDGCRIYQSRPMLCRTYPFSLEQGRLVDMKSRACAVRWDPKTKRQYLDDLQKYETEVEAYRKMADEWNAGPGGDLAGFIRFCLEKAGF